MVPSINGMGVGAVADLFNLRQQNGSQPQIFSRISSSSSPPPKIPDFAFSNMMRKMASKYQNTESSSNDCAVENMSALDAKQEQIKRMAQIFSTAASPNPG